LRGRAYPSSASAVEIVDTTGLFITRVNGQIIKAGPSIAEAGSVSAQRTMQQRNTWMLA